MSIAIAAHVDQADFSALMHRSYRKVFNLAYRLTCSRSDAEDLTQEAFFRAYRGFQEYEGDRPFENWIFRIVTRLFLDLVRSRRRRVQTVSFDAPVRTDAGEESLAVQIADGAPNPEELLMRQTFSESLQSALEGLRPEQRLLVILADVEGMPYAEIAQVAGVPVGTVRSRLHRAHRKLRQAMEAAQQRPAPTPGHRLCACPAS
jgi:RNA polymerase sigma-70 factor (ECF subfamily)